MTEKSSFFTELKRRNVYKVAVAYAIVGWLSIQIATQVFPFLEIPNWVVRLVIVAVAIGFPIALVIAWAFELTPEGLKRTQDVDASSERVRKKRAWIYVVVIGAVISVGLFFVGRYSARSTAAIPQDASPLRIEAATVSTIPQKSIAVLPFENLSSDKENAYFAEGIQDEILTKLATIADLKVISRTSTAKYASKPDNLKMVSQELGAAKLLEGTVQRVGDKVRVNVQLIDASSDSHLWAKSYDGSANDVFNIESKVAQEVAESLKAKLSPAEANTVATAPTKDTAAYELFLKGEFEHRLVRSSLRPEGYDQTTSWYEQAIARDPNFAIAMAHLVICRLERHWFVENLTDAQLAQIKAMAEQAITLAPDASDTHVALGLYYYFGYRQYEQALAEFAKALQLQPNNALALEYSGYVHRRLGQWQQCVTELNKALELDPRNADVAGNLGQTYTLMRQWAEGERVSRHALSIDPHDVIGMRALLVTLINSNGDVAKALQLLKSFPPDEKIITTSIAGTVVSVTGERAYAFVLARDFEAALKVWDGASTNEVDERARLAARATIHVLSGDMAAANRAGEKAVDVIEKRVLERPNELISLRQLSWTYLALGRKADALRVAKEVSRLLPPERDALLGVANLGGLAEIEAHTGATADAVAILHRLLSIPAGETVSIARLKIDPVWDPIRNDPGFQQLLTEKELVGPNK
jgi:TolB-like protein/cytochrome c-type biogenesis protein CcmH/NrfG